MNADGSHVRRITSGDGVDWGPAWRPGGKQLAFFRCTAEGPYDCDLYTVRADGGQLHDLLPGPAVTAHPAWSPDGARLAYTQEGPDGVQVFAMNADGSGATQLTHVPGGVLHPVWSPDGATLAFDTPIGSARGRIGRVQVDGSGFRWLLTDGPGRYDVLRTQSWSADGSALVFTRFRIGQDNGVTSDVYTLNLSDGAIDRITADGASEYPSWSSDGGRIAFDAGPTDRHQLFTVNRDGTGRAQLTDDALSHSDAVWSR
jgi:TolB protein